MVSPDRTSSFDPEHTLLQIRAAQAREPEAFARLFERFSGKLSLVIRANIGTRLRQRVDESDIVQETFLTAWRDLDDFRSQGPGSFFGWLCHIAKRRIKDAGRRHTAKKRDVKREIAGDAGGEDQIPLLIRLAASITSPSALARRREMVARLMAAIDALPEEEREVLCLRELEGRSLKCVAEELDVPISTVSDRTTRARSRLIWILRRA